MVCRYLLTHVTNVDYIRIVPVYTCTVRCCVLSAGVVRWGVVIIVAIRFCDSTFDCEEGENNPLYPARPSRRTKY